MLDFVQDGAAVAFVPKRRARVREREEDSLFERSEIFSQVVYIVYNYAVALLERFPFRRSNPIAAMARVVRAFGWGEEAEGGGDEIADLLKVPRACGA